MICRRRTFRPFAIAALLVMLLASCSTVREPTESATEWRPKLFRTQTGDEVTLQWDSDLGVAYSVVYTQSLSGTVRWRILEGYDAIRGTGNTQSVSFSAPMRGTLYYRVEPSHLIAR